MSLRVCIQSPKKTRGIRVPRIWSYRWLWATQCGCRNWTLVLGKSFLHVVNLWAICPAPGFYSKYHINIRALISSVCLTLSLNRKLLLRKCTPSIYIVLVCGVCMSVGDRGIVSCHWRKYLMYLWETVSMKKPESFLVNWMTFCSGFLLLLWQPLKQLRGGRIYFSFQVTIVCPSMREVMMRTWSQACCGHGIPQWGPEGVAQWYKPANRHTDRHNFKRILE